MSLRRDVKRDFDLSTSTIGGGQDKEEKKLLLAEYMFQRRVLFCCSVLFTLSLFIWIIAISTDRWVIISGGNGGIFIAETRRFFISSHSGLWRHCRYTVIPNALPNANVIRNFTSIAYTNPAVLNEAKINMSHTEFIKEFRNEVVEYPLVNFTEGAKRRMFAYWVCNDEMEFKTFKEAFGNLVLASEAAHAETIPIDAKAIEVNPLDVTGVQSKEIFGSALKKLSINGSSYLFVIPEVAQMAIFDNWVDKRVVPKLFWPYMRDLGVPAYVLNEKRVILQLVPPRPPKKIGHANGYDYISNRRCKYIDMFPNSNSLRNDPGIDDRLMDYIRTQASFACITVFVMCLGVVFSFYTFKNPRYMFKRLAGGIHLVAASCSIVVIQVLISSVDYTREHLFYAYPDGAELTYGYGVYLAWFTFAVNLTCGILFLWYSGKKKGQKAATEELAMADEPIGLGR